MKRIIFFISCSFGLVNCFAQVDRLHLQSCLNIEYAKVLSDISKKGLSEAEGFKQGYARGADFIPFYETHLRALANPEAVIPEMLKIASDAGARMNANLTKDKIQKDVGACRIHFSKLKIKETDIKPSAKDANVKSTEVKKDVEGIALARINPLASLLNRVFFEDGLMGISSLVDSCYYAPRNRGYDCFIMDLGARALDSTLNNQLGAEYFSNEVHAKRVNNAILAGDYKLDDLLKVRDVVLPRIQEALVNDVQKAGIGKRDKCIIVDPDIADSFSGECIEQYAEGYGVAKGRDEYRGEFKRGEVHGKGQYSHGSKSVWATEVFRGSYFRGAKNGFGVLSISANSTHPALESMKRNGKLREERYFHVGMYAAGNLLYACNSEDECLEKFPTIDFSEVSDQIKFGGGAVSAEDLRKLVTKGVAGLNRNESFNVCVASEAFSEFFGQRGSPEKIELAELKHFYRFITTKKYIAQPTLYCFKK
jgi:hypothetical protein